MMGRDDNRTEDDERHARSTRRPSPHLQVPWDEALLIAIWAIAIIGLVWLTIAYLGDAPFPGL